MAINRLGRSCFLYLLHLSLISGSVSAGQVPIDQRVRSGRTREVVISVHDIEVTDHHGRRLRFYTDLLKDRVFVLSFFYTSCNYICPMQTTDLKTLQKMLGARLGT